MTKRCVFALTAFCAATFGMGAADASPSGATAYVNGNWWTGAGFKPKPMFVVDGALRSRRPRGAVSTVDLAGRFVIPPLAEGHNHWLEPAKAAQYNQCYLADGVLYVRDMGNIPLVVNGFSGSLNRADSVDFASALLGFTGPGGHPAEIIDQFVAFGILPKDWKPDYDGLAQFVVRGRSDIDRGLAALAPAKPALVKAFLLFSEDYRASLADPATRGNGRGMDPALLPYLVNRAHAAGFKVAAHIYSAADFRAAIAAGVDEIAHFPGTGYAPKYGFERFVLTPADARAAARAKVTVTTTLTWLGELEADDPGAYAAVRDKIVLPNLRVLRAAGVPLIVGSDSFRQTVLPEIDVLRRLGVFTNAELLSMAGEQTTRTIFPGKRIGRLADGYRADFLVLDRDPLQDLNALRAIHLRVKQGQTIDLPAAAIRRPGKACVEGSP